VTRRRLWPRFSRTSVADEVESELAFHIEMTVRELVEQGMSLTNARAEAERRFGDSTTINAQCRRYGEERDRRARRAEYRHELGQDVAFAVRQLARARGFSIVAIVTLALGIGATAAVFSALDAVALRPLPFADADRIVSIHPTKQGVRNDPSPPEFIAYRGVRAYDHVAAAVLQAGITMRLGDVPEMIGGGRVSADYFAVFGARPFIGRTFTTDEDAPRRANVAVISYRLWMSHFGGDRTALNRVIDLDGAPHTIIGVMPKSFDLTRGSEDIWTPIALTPDDATKYGEHYLKVLARLRPGVSVAAGRAATIAVERELSERLPHRTLEASDYGVDVHRYRDDLVGNFESLLLVLLGAVSFVLLIACGNVANLLLARGSARTKELAIRAALGAGRGRIVRQLLTESVVLAVVGALAGLGVAIGLLRVILSVSPEEVPRLDQASIDWRVLGFTLGVGVLSALFFGLVPAMRAARPELQQTLREGGRGSVTRDRLRPLLVTAEVALAIALLVASGLLIRSAWLMQRVDPGFDPRGVLTARLILPDAHYPTPSSILRAYRGIRDEAARIPGVQSAALTSVVPLSNSSMQSSVAAEGQPVDDKSRQANLRFTSSGYFATMRIPMIAGRDIASTDDANAPPVMVINEALARLLWPNSDPRETIGRGIAAIGPKNGPRYRTVVGIIANVHDAGLDQPPAPEFHIPVEQAPDVIWPLIQRSLVVVVRGPATQGGAEALARPLGRAVARVDASLPLTEAKSMTELMRASLATARMNTVLLSLLGGIALVLAVVGIYGVVSYFVNQKVHEIGIRLALGATPALIWRFVMRRGLAPIVVGVAVGISLSLLTTNVLRQQLFGVTPHDPLTLAGVGSLLLVVAVLAMYVPARRAMRVPPIVALNES
jgi:putative ABC transport system permease protein